MPPRGNRPNSWKEYKCKWYDWPNGEVLGKGCRVPQCVFVHPSDPQWSDLDRFGVVWARPNRASRSPPRRRSNSPNFSIGSSPATDRDRDYRRPTPRRSPRRNSPPIRHDRSRERGRDRSPPPSYRNRSSRERSPPRRGRSRERSPPRGAIPYRAPSQPNTTLDTRKDRDPGPPTRPTVESMRQSSAHQFVPPRPPTDAVPKPSDNAGHMRPPPAPQPARAMNPPPPPNVPPLAPPPPFPSTLPPANMFKDLTPAEKEAAWMERIVIMSDAVQHRTEYAKLEAELFRLKKMSNSSGLDNLPADAVGNLRARIIALEAQCAQKVKQLSGVVDRLVATNFWPVLSGGNVVGHYAEAKRHLDEVRANVAEMYDKVKTLTAPWQRTFSAVGSSTDALAGQRPVKRRRTEASDQENGGDNDIDSKELEELNEKIEVRITDLENYFSQRDEDLTAILDTKIEEKLEESIDMLQKQSDAKRDYLLGQLAAAQATKSDEFDASLRQMGDDIAELAKELAQLVASGREQELQDIRDDNARLSARLLAVEAQQARTHNELAQSATELEALKFIIQKVLESPPAAPSARPVPQVSPEVVLEALQDPLLDMVRREVLPLLQQFKSEVDEVVETSNSRLYQTIWDKLQVSMNVFSTIQAWMQRESNLRLTAGEKGKMKAA